uniref:TFIIS N-terminal domain-containing protein n=4 Tax=Boreoeutheria TaxID=1437010 RepID=A0ABI7Y3T4_FELCA
CLSGARGARLALPAGAESLSRPPPPPPPPPRAWFARKGLGPGLLWGARRAPGLASRRPLGPSFAHFRTQTGWARGRPAEAMEDEVVRIAKKMDKMVQKKNAAGALDLLKELKNIPMTLELLQLLCSLSTI